MKKYIEAEKFKKSIKELTSCMFSYEMTTGEIEDDFFELVDDEPAADVQEVKHGEWREHNKIYICSQCGYSFENEGYIAFFNYCPCCGARMDGEHNA